MIPTLPLVLLLALWPAGLSSQVSAHQEYGAIAAAVRAYLASFSSEGPTPGLLCVYQTTERGPVDIAEPLRPFLAPDYSLVPREACEASRARPEDRGLVLGTRVMATTEESVEVKVWQALGHVLGAPVFYWCDEEQDAWAARQAHIGQLLSLGCRHADGESSIQVIAVDQHGQPATGLWVDARSPTLGREQTVQLDERGVGKLWVGRDRPYDLRAYGNAYQPSEASLAGVEVPPDCELQVRLRMFRPAVVPSAIY